MTNWHVPLACLDSFVALGLVLVICCFELLLVIWLTVCSLLCSLNMVERKRNSFLWVCGSYTTECKSNVMRWYLFHYTSRYSSDESHFVFTERKLRPSEMQFEVLVLLAFTFWRRGSECWIAEKARHERARVSSSVRRTMKMGKVDPRKCIFQCSEKKILNFYHFAGTNYYYSF